MDSAAPDRAPARPAPIGLKAALAALPHFLAYVMRHFPLARLTFALSVLLLLLEYAGFSLMIPLAAAASGTGAPQASGGVVLAFWARVAHAMRLPADAMTWLWLFLILLALRTMLGYVHLLLTNWVSRQVHRHLSERTLHRVLVDEPMAHIYRRSIGHYVTLAGDDTFRAGTIVNTALQALANLLSALAGFSLLYLFSVPVFWATLGFLSVCAVVAAVALRSMVRLNGRSVQLSRELGTAFIEALNGLRSIRSMGSERFFEHSYDAQITRYLRLLFGIDAIKNGTKFMPAIVALIAGVVVVWPGTAQAANVTAGVFFAATLLLIRLFASLGATVNQLSVMLMDLRAATDIQELLQDGPAHDDPAAALAAEPLREIELRSVGYGYRSGHKVLDRLNLRLLPGHAVAIVGPSGSGKSTLADMLLGLLQPDSGELLVNGRSGAVAALRHHVILVEQQARIFSTSVRENLLLGERHDDDALWSALRQVELEGYVRGLPGGLSAPFDYQGANLSGGQRQRLGIARALIRAPQVLILDEATSALDPATRVAVVRNLRAALRDRILIFITHDESVVAEADMVLDLGVRTHETCPVEPTATVA